MKLDEREPDTAFPSHCKDVSESWRRLRSRCAAAHDSKHCVEIATLLHSIIRGGSLDFEISCWLGPKLLHMVTHSMVGDIGKLQNKILILGPELLHMVICLHTPVLVRLKRSRECPEVHFENAVHVLKASSRGFFCNVQSQLERIDQRGA